MIRRITIGCRRLEYFKGSYLGKPCEHIHLLFASEDEGCPGWIYDDKLRIKDARRLAKWLLSVTAPSGVKG